MDQDTQDSKVPLLPETPDITNARNRWQFTGKGRPHFALTPQAGQESVWDYPRPPAVARCTARLRVYAGSQLVADTGQGMRVLETAGAPTYYFPPDDVEHEQLTFGELTSVCEWKGLAQTIGVAGHADAAWRYVQMFPDYEELYRWVSFYPSRLDCYIGDEKVSPQPGGYYGGWVTASIAGPVKGDPGSQDW